MRAHAVQEVRLETYSCLADARALYRRLGFRMTGAVPGQKAYGKRFEQEFRSLNSRPGPAFKGKSGCSVVPVFFMGKAKGRRNLWSAALSLI